MANTIQAGGYDIAFIRQKGLGDFISLTDIARFKTAENPGYAIQNWMRNRNTVRFLALWESFTTRILIASNSRQLKKKPG